MPNYSGMWTLQAQMQAVSQGNWQLAPVVGLLTWGANGSGQLGQNDTVYRSSPTQVGNLATWNNIGVTTAAEIATKTDGTLWSWGANYQGELGQNDKVARSSPIQVGALTNWSLVTGDKYRSTYSIKTDGTLWSWGQNAYGQLGQGGTIFRSSPVQVGLLTDWSKISTGYAFVFAIKTGGTLWSWGYNANGQLGLNNAGVSYQKNSPNQIGALTTWSKVACGYNWGLATKTDGTLWAWGKNDDGQLGQNDRVARSSPVQVGALTTWLNITGGYYHAVATKTDGTLWSWGKNQYGQLGQNDIVNRSSPVQVGAITSWSLVTAGSYHTLATTSSNVLWSWGLNTAGQLGDNTVINRSSPIQITSFTNWSKIAGGSYFSLATTS